VQGLFEIFSFFFFSFSALKRPVYGEKKTAWDSKRFERKPGASKIK
jgi:hypothetical protein